eukprot:15469767-Alexandrium_andersonii.AAC.1
MCIRDRKLPGVLRSLPPLRAPQALLLARAAGRCRLPCTRQAKDAMPGATLGCAHAWHSVARSHAPLRGQTKRGRLSPMGGESAGAASGPAERSGRASE